MRLFAALPLSLAAVDRLTALRLRLSTPTDGLRWSPPEQWHLTLQFYGEITEAQAADLARSLSEVQLLAPQLRLETLGRFVAKGILYAALEPSPSLLALQETATKTAERSGLQLASRPFHPHVTLARSKGRSGLKTLERMSKPALPSLGAALSWQPTELLLLRSDLLPEGALYTPLATLPLV